MMIITDSASDITEKEAEEMDIRLVWLKTKFSDGDFPMKTEKDFCRFFDKLAEEKDLPMTSQPSPEEYLEFFEEAKSKGRRGSCTYFIKWTQRDDQCRKPCKTDE